MFPCVSILQCFHPWLTGCARRGQGVIWPWPPQSHRFCPQRWNRCRKRWHQHWLCKSLETEGLWPRQPPSLVCVWEPCLHRTGPAGWPGQGEELTHRSLNTRSTNSKQVFPLLNLVFLSRLYCRQAGPGGPPTGHPRQGVWPQLCPNCRSSGHHQCRFAVSFPVRSRGSYILIP